MTTDDKQYLILTDRSRIEDAEKCMRLRYWGYEHEGIGVSKGGEWLDPLVGTAVHTGTEQALFGHNVEDSVVLAQEEMLRAQREGSITVFRPGPSAEADFNEGLMLAEALVRGWIAVRLPRILAEYEILFTERECNKDYRWQNWTVRQMSRPDIVLRRRSDRAVFITNLKTASRIDQKWRGKWQYDMQTFSEALAVEELLGEPVAGTIMVGLVKGSRSDYPKGSGDFHWSDSLIFAWHRTGQPPMTEDLWEPRYEYSCDAPHVMGNGRKCPGGKQHKLSGVHKARVDGYPGGVRGWINHLAANEREYLENQFVELPPILRSAYDIERWKRQKLPAEVRIRENRDYLAGLSDDDPTKEELFDQWFPMATAAGNCVWPSQCKFFEICHGVARDDLAGNGFVARDPNHPQEVDNEA